MFHLGATLWWLFCTVCAWVGLSSVVTYLLVQGVQQLAMHVPQDFKKKYNAEWGLVTGSSSGIGKSIAEKLAAQGINVVLVALDDTLLADTAAELEEKYPAVQFRKVGVNLSSKDYVYMKPILASTEDLPIRLVFNNAGYISTGLFADADLERLRCNLECNAGCAVAITHHFLRKMVAQKAPGLIAFTSSAACYLPGPTATLYSPTKAFISSFAATIAAENRDLGIDVVVIHPSPVATNFYKNEGPALSALSMAQKVATTPMDVANQIFAAAGRLTVWDQGFTCAAFRLANKLIDHQLLEELVTRLAAWSGDHQRLSRASKLRNSKKTL